MYPAALPYFHSGHPLPPQRLQIFSVGAAIYAGARGGNLALSFPRPLALCKLVERVVNLFVRLAGCNSYCPGNAVACCAFETGSRSAAVVVDVSAN